MASFSFAFAGDDIDTDAGQPQAHDERRAHQPSAFPIPGNPHHLPPQHHDLASLLAGLPSKIAYSALDIRLDDAHQTTVRLPRRELWDVRVQLMAEEKAAGHQDGDDGVFLGAHDVKTGVYEGGFKSWESSGDLVKVLAAECHPRTWGGRSARVMELGCGTALPSLALFQWVMASKTTNSISSSDQAQTQPPVSFILADYNPTVLQLVTLPNFILSWALHQHHHAPLSLPVLHEAFSLPGELELGPALLDAFRKYLSDHAISLSFLSGAWSARFLDLMYSLESVPPIPAPGSDDDMDGHGSRNRKCTSLLLSAETIYSPLALQTFRDMVLSILERETEMYAADAAPDVDASAWVAAKKLYFGVGGSLDDFVAQLRHRGLVVDTVREENEGVRRAIVRCVRPR
ncbi:hypothetical protein E4U21_003158 [Claviceps maximensis]|nr:hypothetical protein E4U21_003158 [Claviceps maximensis]